MIFIFFIHEIRKVFPSRALTDAGVTDRYLRLYRVQQEEPARLEARKREQQLYMIGIGFLVVLAPGSLFLFIWFYHRYGRRYKPETGSFERYLYAPPSDHPPALVRKLMLGPPSAEPDQHCLGITLFDLARKGYYRIVEKKGEKKFPSSQMPQYHLEKTEKKPEPGLHDWESALLERVNSRIDDGETRMEKIMEWSDKDTKTWWKNWRKLFSKNFKKTGWFDQAAIKALYFHLLAQAPILFGMVVVTILAGPVGLAGIAIAVFMMFLSLTLPRRSQEAVDLLERWTSYRKALKKGSDPSFDQRYISRHFVYAIALGLSRKQVEKILINVGEESSLFLWIVPTAGTHASAGIASGLSTLASSGTRSFSGVSGGSGASAG